MPTEKDLFDMVTDLLSEVDLYLDEVRNLHYDNEFREFSTSKGKRNRFTSPSVTYEKTEV